MFMILDCGFPILDLTINCKSSIINHHQSQTTNRKSIHYLDFYPTVQLTAVR
jgi:hypothetical protein